MHISQWGAAIEVVAAILIGTACADVSPGRSTPSDVRAAATRVGTAVSKEVAATLSPNGEIPIEVDNRPGSEITAARAIELGLAYMRVFGPYNRTILEGAVGMAIDFSALTAEPRVFFAASPYEDLDNRFSKPSAKAMGPYYVITLSQRGVPVISLAVSAKASDLRIVNDSLRLPVTYGNEFWIIPITRRLQLPLTPEAAAVIAHEATGLIVSEAPLLVIPERANFAPQYSMWRLVGFQTNGSSGNGALASDTLYVTFDGKLLKRSGTVDADTRTLFPSTAGSTRVEATMRERAGIASRFDSVNLPPGGQL